MANPEQLEYLQATAQDWNVYRHDHALAHPDLMGADLTNATLLQADLTGANLTDVDLSKADLTAVVGLNSDGR